jgi:adenylate cyclase
VSYELARAIGNELDIQKVLDRILVAAFQLLQADRGIVLLYGRRAVSSSSRARSHTRGHGDPSEPVLISSTIVDQVREPPRQAVLSSDAMVDSRFKRRALDHHAGHPLLDGGAALHSDELFGIMLLDSQIATNAFTEKDLQLFQNVANQAAMAVQNSLFAKKLEAEAVTRERFQRSCSPAIAQQVLDGKVEIQKGGEVDRRQCSSPTSEASPR